MSHYYTQDGTPRYTVPKKDGSGERSTTIADARKLKLLPSVTTVLQVLAKPGLDRWKLMQVADACYDDKITSTEWELEDYSREMIKRAFEQVDDAADLGTLIHKALECYFQRVDFNSLETVVIGDKTVGLHEICTDVEVWTEDNLVSITESELCLVDGKHGFAGLTDCVILKEGKHGILDFKTRKFDQIKGLKPYDEHPVQIAAYHMAKYGQITDDAIGCNLYISSTVAGLIHGIWYDAPKLRESWEIFKAALTIWKIQKNYQSGTVS